MDLELLKMWFCLVPRRMVFRTWVCPEPLSKIFTGAGAQLKMLMTLKLRSSGRSASSHPFLKEAEAEAEAAGVQQDSAAGVQAALTTHHRFLKPSATMIQTVPEISLLRRHGRAAGAPA
jgi:hypothetical protein